MGVKKNTNGARFTASFGLIFATTAKRTRDTRRGMSSDSRGTLRPNRRPQRQYHALYAATVGFMTAVALQHVVVLVALIFIPIHLFRRTLLVLCARLVTWIAQSIRPYFYMALFDAIDGTLVIMDTINEVSVRVEGYEVKGTSVELLRDLLDTFERMSIIMEYFAEGRLVEKSVRPNR